MPETINHLNAASQGSRRQQERYNLETTSSYRHQRRRLRVLAARYAMLAAQISGLPTADMRITLLPISIAISGKVSSIPAWAGSANWWMLSAQLPFRPAKREGIAQFPLISIRKKAR